MKFFLSYSLGLSCSPEPFTFVSLLHLSLSLEATCLFYHFYAFLSTPFFAFCFFLHFISLFLSLFVHFALLLCSFDTIRRCKKKRNKARGFPRYGSPRALIYHTAKKNYLILKKGYSKHTGRNIAFLPIIKMLKNIFFRLLF